MLASLASGALLGLSCGLAPGPLMALVLAQTLRYGAREGCKVALSPLATDAPIIVVAVAVAAKSAELRPMLGIVSFAGGIFVLYLAWESFRPTPASAQAPVEAPRSWLKGILTNLLSPHPWLFWLTVGTAILGNAIAQSWLTALAFLLGFYVMLVGSKLVLALLTARSRAFVTGRVYGVVMSALGVLLVCFAVLLFREGFKHLAAV